LRRAMRALPGMRESILARHGRIYSGHDENGFITKRRLSPESLDEFPVRH
jgi:hypothetical protein